MSDETVQTFDQAPTPPPQEAPPPEAPAPLPEAVDPMILEPTALNAEETPEAPPPDAAFDPSAQPQTPEPAPQPVGDDIVRFRSAMPEINQFDVMDIYPRRDESLRYLIWEMDAETAERFSRHYFIESGRIVRMS